MANVNDNQTEESVRLYTKSSGHFDYPLHFYQDPRDTSSLNQKRGGPQTERDVKGVLLLYTGGTIGSSFQNRNESRRLQFVNQWPTLRASIQALHTGDVGTIPFPVDAVTFTEPLDSSNIGPLHWSAMARIIERYYDSYEGFVILHGTDTLVYTASALSFMLNNLSKPIIVTGSQLSAIDNIRTDAQQNLLTSILIANPKYSRLPVVPEVCVFSRDQLLRGNRAKKVNAQAYTAFGSPNFPPLGRVGSRIEIDEKIIMPVSLFMMYVTTALDTNIVLLDLFPGIQDSGVMEGILNIPGLRGVVLRTFGSDHMPSSQNFLDQIRQATENGIIIINVTQCSSGMVEMGAYDSTERLLDCGVISGLDITSEAAFCKLMVLLGDEDLQNADIRSLVQIARCGEQSYSVYTATFRSDAFSQISTDSKRYRLPLQDVNTHNTFSAFRILLRFESATVAAVSESVTIKLFLNLGINDEADETSQRFVGSFTAVRCQVPQSVIFDITSAAESILQSRLVSFTMILDGDGAFKWKEVELAQFVRE